MNRFVRLMAGSLIFVALAAAASAAAGAAPKRVVASTTWTAALAAAAGATDIVTLAPSSLRHPAEYDLAPSDIARIAGADLIVASGFEVMAAKLADAAGSRRIPVLRVDADYSLATMRASITAIGKAIGTEAVAARSVDDIAGFLSSWKTELASAGLVGAPVVAHVFQKPLLDDLGLATAGVFGPGPLEAAQITRLSATKARLIVDNWHNEAAGPLRETMPGAGYVSLINFPGPDGTATLLDVLRDDRARLKAALGY